MKFSAVKRSIEFTIEESETYRICRTVRLFAAWCDACRREVEMANPETAAGIANVTERRIYAGIEDGRTHFSESEDGSLMVCLDSVAELRKSEKGELDRQ